MPAGKPTLYNEEMIEKTRQYIEKAEDDFTEGKKKVELPSIEGLAFYLKVNRDTIYEWRKVHPEYSDIIDELLAKQARALINNGLAGTYNSTIAKVILSKHGYREAIDGDVTSGGEKLNVNVIGYKDNNNTSQLSA